MKKVIRGTATRILALFLSVLLIFSTSGCVSFVLFHAFDDAQQNSAQEQEIITRANGEYIDLSYDELCEVFFNYEVTGDNLTLNQLVSDPEALGIKVPRPATLGEYSYESTLEDNQFYSEIYKALTGGHTIDVSKLDKSQQLEAEYMEKVLRQQFRYEQFFFYLEPLSPSTGAQAWIPLSLMDYNFRTVDDVDIYLELLEDMPRYFEQILACEEKKEQQQLLMPREAMENSIEEAYAYTKSVDTNVLVTAFDEMLDTAVVAAAEASNSDVTDEVASLATLTEQQVLEYKQQNREHVQNYVIPAYEHLILGLEALVSSCQEGTRLCDYPQGTEYYELLLESMGVSGGAASAAKTLDNALENYWNIIVDSSATVDMDDVIPESVVQAIGETPKDYITYIEEHSTKEFASAGALDYTIKVAPDASPNDYAMAYYLIPPVDDPQHNTIVFFPRNIAGDVELFSTMAHEGYPGHMYQVYAYSLTNPSNISKILGCSASMEGWAMYAQSRAMLCLDTSTASIEVYNAYEKFLYGLQARVDIGINFEGWDISATERYLANWGFENAAQSLYDTNIEQPSAFLPYGLGVIEFDGFRQQAESQLGKEFDAITFHQKITSLGALPFDMLEREFELWLTKSNAEKI